jgi:hypothetical protein
MMSTEILNVTSPMRTEGVSHDEEGSLHLGGTTKRTLTIKKRH